MTSPGRNLLLNIEVKGNVATPGDGRHHRIHLRSNYQTLKNREHLRVPEDPTWPKITTGETPLNTFSAKDTPLILGCTQHSSKSFSLKRGCWSNSVSDESRTCKQVQATESRRSFTSSVNHRRAVSSDPRFHRTVIDNYCPVSESEELNESLTAINFNPEPSWIWRGAAEKIETIQAGDGSNSNLFPESFSKDENTVEHNQQFMFKPFNKNDVSVQKDISVCHKAVQTQGDTQPFWDLSRLHQTVSLRRVESESSLDQFVIRCRNDCWGGQSTDSDRRTERNGTVSCKEQECSNAKSLVMAVEKNRSNAGNSFPPIPKHTRITCSKHKANTSDPKSYKSLGLCMIFAVLAVIISSVIAIIMLMDLLPMIYNWLFEVEEDEYFWIINWLIEQIYYFMTS